MCEMKKLKKKKEWRAKSNLDVLTSHYSQLKFKVHHISNYTKAELIE